jgi:HPt (histidine-containing phosphotransfer) domain-containing protein
MIDTNSLSKFIRMGGNELALELVDRFLKEAPERLAKACEALARGDCVPVEEHCHRLASDSGWLGAKAFQKLASRAEVLAIEKDAGQLHGVLVELESRLGPLLEELPGLRQALLEGRDPCDSG